MTEHTKVTVIMSVRNGETYIGSSIDSIMKQTYKNFEFFITDDGSNDNTLSILENYAKLYSQIRIFQNKISLGLPGSLNMMAKHAKGKYLARMDADDIAHKNRFERQVAFMDRFSDVDVCFANVNYINEEERIICTRWVPNSLDSILNQLPYINHFTHPTAMLRISSFMKIGGYNELFLIGQDLELWQRMVAQGMRLKIIREVLLDYRLNKQGNSIKLSRSSMKSEAFFEANLLIQNGYRYRALLLLHKMSLLEYFEFVVRFLLPRSLFFQLIKIRARYSKNSPQQQLLKQGSGNL